MSRSNNAAIMQIAVISGMLETLRVLKCFSRVDIKRRISVTIEHISYAMTIWPESGDRRKNQQQIKAWMAEWKKHVDTVSDDIYSTVVFCKMIERLATALDEVVKNPFKRKLLEPVIETAEALNNFIDPDGANFPAYERADVLVGKLYEIVGMREYA